MPQRHVQHKANQAGPGGVGLVFLFSSREAPAEKRQDRALDGLQQQIGDQHVAGQADQVGHGARGENGPHGFLVEDHEPQRVAAEVDDQLPTFPRGIKETSWSIKSKRDFFNREIYG